VFLIDTNIVSEARKGILANQGVRDFFERVAVDGTPVFVSVVTIGEIRRGVELVRYRGDMAQAEVLELWLSQLLANHQDFILEIDSDIAQLWGRMRVPNHENALDKLIAATALIHSLCVVTRNHDDFHKTGVTVLNPFV